MMTFASVINENIVHMGIERYILNYLSIILSGHPFIIIIIIIIIFLLILILLLLLSLFSRLFHF